MLACAKCGTNLDPGARFCPACGTPQVPSPPQPIAPPQIAPQPQPGYITYPYAPISQKNHTVLIIVVVIIAILLPVLFGALIYLAVSPGPTPNPNTSKPILTFAAPRELPGAEQLTIAAVSAAVSPTNLRVNLGASGQTGVAVSAPVGSGWPYRAYLQVGFDSYAVEWTDVGGEGRVSTGDMYTVYVVNGTWPSGTTMTFYLLWWDGSLIASVNWLTLSKPVVAFSTPMPSGSGEAFAIAGVSQAVGPANYQVNLAENGSFGYAVTMPTIGGGFVVLYGGTRYYRVNWTDIGGDGLVNLGDYLSITHTDSTGTLYLALPSLTQFTFYLLWSDGSQITTVTWTTP